MCLPVQSQGGAEPEEEKTEFTVKLVKYTDDSKIKLIKEVKTLMEGMNLVQVRNFSSMSPICTQSSLFVYCRCSTPLTPFTQRVCVCTVMYYMLQAKKFVEGVPQVVQADVKKEEAERLKAALEAVGGIVEID